MDEAVYEVLSSRTRMKIAEMISERPRSLDELREATGISVQGVLKQLEKLKKLGFAEEAKVSDSSLSVRKVFGAGKMTFGDYSEGRLVVAVTHESRRVSPGGPGRSLDALAEDALIQRLRIREETRRMERLIDEFQDTEQRIKFALDSAGLDPGEKLILQALFAEESLKDGEAVLTRNYGMKGGRRSIDKALAKAKHIVG